MVHLISDVHLPVSVDSESHFLSLQDQYFRIYDMRENRC